MKMRDNAQKIIRYITAFMILPLVLSLSTGIQAKTSSKTASTPGVKKATPSEKDSERFISIDFNNVDINVFIKFISELTNRNFVVDQRVRGKVTIISPSRISVKEAYKVFESVLEVHGFTAVCPLDSEKVTNSGFRYYYPDEYGL